MTHAEKTPHGTGDGDPRGIARDGYEHAQPHDLKTSEVEGATVYGCEHEEIGTVSSLDVATDGAITEVVIEVGGFLGVGAHSVLLPVSQLTVLRQTNGADIYLHLETTKEELRAMTHHAG